MGRALKPVAVIAGGVVLAVPMAWATFAAWFSSFGVAHDAYVEWTWILIARLVVVAVLMLWITAWCAWRAAGWARFVSAAVLVLPLLFLLRNLVEPWGLPVRLASWSQLRAGPVGLLETWQFAILVLPAGVSAICVLVLAVVPVREPGEETRRRFVPLVRTIATAGAVVGALAPVGWFVALAHAGIG